MSRSRKAAFLLAAGLLAGCRAGAPEADDLTTTVASEAPPPSPAPAPTRNIVPMPAIPVALRGCWTLDDSDFPDIREQLVVTDSGLTRDGRIARPEFIDSVSPRYVGGRFSAEENGHLITVATALELRDDEGELTLREGDAGSFFFRRCTP